MVWDGSGSGAVDDGGPAAPLLLLPPPPPQTVPPSIQQQQPSYYAALRLLLAAGTRPALILLPALAAADALLSSRAGAVVGQFYALLVDRDAAALRPAFARAALLYAASALAYAAQRAAREWLSLRWRGALSLRAHGRFCHDVDDGDINKAAAGASWAGPLAPPYLVLPSLLDTPDQRMAQDLPALTDAMADVAAGLAAAPLGVCLYAYLAAGAFGSRAPLLAAGAFFVVGAALQRAAAAPVAAGVTARAAAEGALRRAHARLWARADDVAMCRGADAERAALDANLAGALRAPRALVPRRALLAALTRALDYGGALLNYACLAAAVFGSAWAAAAAAGSGSGDAGGGATPGSAAERISVASFYLLMLVNALTEVLDLADRASDLAGLAARVAPLVLGQEAANRAMGALQQGGQQAQLKAAATAEASAGGTGKPTSPAPGHLYVCMSFTQGGRGSKAGEMTLHASAREAAAAAYKAGIGTQQLSQSPSSLLPLSPAPPPPPAPPPVLACAGLCVSTRAGTVAARSLTLALPARGRLLVTGPNGAGKSTLLRVLAGLERADEGAAARPCRCFDRTCAGSSASNVGGGRGGSNSGVLFLPQRPLAGPPGTLRQQRAYPAPRATAAVAAAAAARAALRAVGLAPLIARAGGLDGGAADWGAELSPGELQRLAFARVLVAAPPPALVLLDEPTSAVAAADERALFELLFARGCAVVTVGHSAALAACHDVELSLVGDGGWSLRPCPRH